MTGLWEHDERASWQAALATYPAVIARQGIERLPALDRWYREELPALLMARRPTYVTQSELVRTVEWKMARGVWRQRNLVLVRSNAAAVVEAISREALARLPEPTAPLTGLARLAGVGPATASAIVAAVAPEHYPFFDELVAGQLPDFGAVAFTLGEYRRYTAALIERATQLGPPWTATLVERALWAAVGGKTGPAALAPSSDVPNH
jgi:hypothetical protein